MNSISVLIVTRNNSRDLVACLSSVISQSVMPDEIIVVDNGSSDQTKILVKSLNKNIKANIRYLYEERIGYPIACNTAISKVKSAYFTFLDDDCVVNVDWLEKVKKSMKRNASYEVILGNAIPFYKNNMVSVSKNLTDSFGKIGTISSDNKILDLEIVDTKCSIYLDSFIKKNKIFFNEKLLTHGRGGSADCDFGMQIQQKGGQAIYDSHIEVMHKDLTSLVLLMRKIVSITKDHVFYEREWSGIRRDLHIRRPFWKRINFFISYSKNLKLGNFHRWELAFYVSLIAVLIKFIKLLAYFTMLSKTNDSI